MSGTEIIWQKYLLFPLSGLLSLLQNRSAQLNVINGGLQEKRNGKEEDLWFYFLENNSVWWRLVGLCSGGLSLSHSGLGLCLGPSSGEKSHHHQGDVKCTPLSTPQHHTHITSPTLSSNNSSFFFNLKLFSGWKVVKG